MYFASYLVLLLVTVGMGHWQSGPYSPTAHNGSVSSGMDNGVSDESDEDNSGRQLVITLNLLSWFVLLIDTILRSITKLNCLAEFEIVNVMTGRHRSSIVQSPYHSGRHGRSRYDQSGCVTISSREIISSNIYNRQS